MGWQRLRRPLRLRSRRYVETTASKCGTRPLIKLRWRPHLHLGEQRVYTTLLPSAHQVLPASRLIPPLRWQSLERIARPRSPSLLNTLPRRLSNSRLLKKKLTQPREWPLMPSSPQLLLKTRPKRRRYPLKMEIVFATLPMLAKGDLKGKGLEASEAALTQSTKAPTTEKIVIIIIIIIIKQFRVVELFYFILFLFPQFVTNLIFCNPFAFFKA